MDGFKIKYLSKGRKSFIKISLVWQKLYINKNL